MALINPRDPVSEDPAIEHAALTAADPYECAAIAVREAIKTVQLHLGQEDPAVAEETISTLDTVAADLGFYGRSASEKAAMNYGSDRAVSYTDHRMEAAE